MPKPKRAGDSVADPDLQIRGGAVIQTLRDKGGSQKIFQPFGSQFGLKISTLDLLLVLWTHYVANAD